MAKICYECRCCGKLKSGFGRCERCGGNEFYIKKIEAPLEPKELDAADIASAIATWAKINGYKVYSCGTERTEDGRVLVEASVQA